MKTIELQIKEMESIGHALRTMFDRDENIMNLLNRYDLMVVEVRKAWQDSFHEATKITQLQQKINYLQNSKDERGDKYLRIREICEE